MKYALLGWIIALTLSITFSHTSAQQLPPTLSTDRYEKGIYQNFSEFLLNKPSIKPDFQIITTSDDDKIKKGVANFKLIMPDSAVRRRDAKKFWGVSDGESIYINGLSYEEFKGTIFTDGRFVFRKIQGLGRYCYFMGTIVTTSPGLGANAMPAQGVADAPYILNVNNGKFFQLNQKLLTTILKQDQELLGRYEKEERKRKNNSEVLFTYIREYNSRHGNEAFMDVTDPIEVIIYRKDKKETAGPFTILINDSTQLEINDYDLQKHFSTTPTFSFCIDGQCNEIALTKKGVNYFECVLNKTTGKPGLVKVDREEGEFFYKKIEASLSKEKKEKIQ